MTDFERRMVEHQEEIACYELAKARKEKWAWLITILKGILAIAIVAILAYSPTMIILQECGVELTNFMKVTTIIGGGIDAIAFLGLILSLG